MTGVSLDDVNKNKMLIYHGGGGNLTGDKEYIHIRSAHTSAFVGSPWCESQVWVPVLKD